MRPQTNHKPVPTPLPITEAEHLPAMFSFRGADWSFSALAAWRWVTALGDVVGERTDNAGERICELIGDEVAGIRWHGTAEIKDPTFDLASGGEITILSDATFDTWTFQAYGGYWLGPNIDTNSADISHPEASGDSYVDENYALSGAPADQIAPEVGLPLAIASATYVDQQLVLSGTSWRLSINCEWRCATDAGDVISGAIDDPHTRIQELVGDDIVGVTWFGPQQFGLDPTFTLASGRDLTLLSDTAADNWMLSTDAGTLTGPVRT